MNVRAMVMAAGAGTRLHPLTAHIPKPMVPIANRPVMEYTLLNLKRHGITEIILNLHSHPTLIQNYFQSGARWGVRLNYSHEPKLLGTAGGVRKVEKFFAQKTCLVTSGDGLTDIDLTRLLAFHAKRKATATMALKSVDTKFEYGITLTNSQGRITRFVEKPYWGDVFSNHVNTGIYVLEPRAFDRFPRQRVVDFGHDVWPGMLKKGEKLFAQLSTQYWCDIGNPNEYRRAQNDFLNGHMSFELPGRRIHRGVWVEPGAHIDPGVRIEGPCLIGQNVHIARGSHIGPHTVIGADSRIGKNSHVRSTTLWSKVRVAENVRLEGCIVGDNTAISRGVSVYGGILVPETSTR